MEANRLIREEIEYECRIRGVENFAALTVAQMRNWLADALRKENIGSIGSSSKVVLDPVKETTICQTKIGELKERINLCNGDRNNNEGKRIETKLAHVLGRVSRITLPDDSDTGTKDQLMTAVYELEVEFENKCSIAERPRTAITRAPESARPREQESVTAENSRVPEVHRKTVPVSRWNLKFSGDGRGLSVNAFLLNVEEHKRANHVSDIELFDSAFLLLQGDALVYFRSIQSKVHNWGSLANHLREEYQPYDYEVELWNEIRSRGQGRNERIGAYIACMINLFNRLPTPPSEKEKLTILRRNIAPYLITGIGINEIESVDDLLRITKTLEVNHLMANKTRPAPVNRTALLEPDLCDNSMASGRNQREVFVADEPRNERGRERTCWNCGSKEHLFSRCRQDVRGDFCFSCGRRGVRKINCPKCGQGNARRGGVGDRRPSREVN